MGYVRPKRAKRPANRPKWPSHSFRRRVWATRFFEILDPGAFDEHFFNGLLVAGLEGHFRSRSAGPARLLMMDIDHFKRINDTFGHQAGDVVLCHIADVLRRTLRRGDLACRTGGEEFVIVCFEASDEGIIRLAERVRTAVEEHVVPLPGEKTSRRCTVTIGVSLDFHSSDGLDGAWQEADAALYRGKAGGRNRVEWGTRQGGQAGPHFTRPAQQLHAT